MNDEPPPIRREPMGRRCAPMVDMPGADENRSAARVGRGYLAIQGVAGALWSVAVFVSDDVRRLTLGEWSPTLLVVPDLILFAGCSLLAAATGRWTVAALVSGWTAAITVALVATAVVAGRAGWGAVAMVVATAGSLGATLLLRDGAIPTRWFFVGPFRFRPARPHSDGVHLFHSLAQLVVFWTLLLGVLPVAAAVLEHRMKIDAPVLDESGVALAGWIVFGVGCAVGLWSCAVMALRGHGTPLPSATAQALVIDGPYKLVRNPMAVAGVAQTIGVGLVLGSWVVLVAAVLGAVVWDTQIRPVEEADLARRLGVAYDDYRSRVRCWVPALRR